MNLNHERFRKRQILKESTYRTVEKTLLYKQKILKNLKALLNYLSSSKCSNTLYFWDDIKEFKDNKLIFKDVYTINI